ncbi:MAG TPA: M15 family metallopeptidase [Candidatus Saccharimonadales bacterium]|nr:M15 family metallopeptidase [Candidatus Saccharimonadales bacterium]
MSSTLRRVTVLAIIVLAGAGAYYGFHRQRAEPAKQTAITRPQTQTGTTQKPADKPPQQLGKPFDKAKYSIDAADSLWIVVNKQRPLQPADYVPSNLVIPDIPLRSNITNDEKYVRADNAKALKTMVDAAAADGIHLNLQSGYRSYKFQVNLYNLYVKQQGRALADSQSARPGHSEHQTGLAADLGGTTNPGCNVEECFADTPEGKWLGANAYKYGYIIRYPQDKTAITGYTYEPWHVRYVGTYLSEEMHQEGIETLEEFFGLPAAPDYH